MRCSMGPLSRYQRIKIDTVPGLGLDDACPSLSSGVFPIEGNAMLFPDCMSSR
jgi:hypothetical protein